MPVSFFDTHTTYTNALTLTVPILHLLHLLPIILGQPPDENCTRIELGKTPVPRIGCAAESCLRCNGVDAECVHNGTSNTFTCTANTTTCSVELCPLCNYCVGAYIQPLGNSGFRHHSLCIYVISWNLWRCWCKQTMCCKPECQFRVGAKLRRCFVLSLSLLWWELHRAAALFLLHTTTTIFNCTAVCCHENIIIFVSYSHSRNWCGQ